MSLLVPATLIPVNNQTFPVIYGITVSNLTALAALPGYKPGSVVRVSSVGRCYISVPTGKNIIDNIITIAGSSCDWQSVPGTTDGYWLTQPYWYVDPTNGNDENDGYTSLTALKTPNEIQRRWGCEKPYLTQTTTIYLLAGTHALVELRAHMAANCDLFVLGSPTTITTDTVAAYSAANFVTGVGPKITGTTIGDWTPYVTSHYRIRFGNSVAVAWPLLANPESGGNNVARISVPESLALAPVTPVVGQTITIEQLPHVIMMRVDVSYDNQAGWNYTHLYHLDIDVLNVSGEYSINGLVLCQWSSIHNWTFYSCSNITNQPGFYLYGCLVYFTGLGQVNTGGIMWYCGMKGPAGSSNNATLYSSGNLALVTYQCIYQDVGVSWYSGSESQCGNVIFYGANQYVSEDAKCMINGSVYNSNPWDINLCGKVILYTGSKLYGAGFHPHINLENDGITDGTAIPWANNIPRAWAHGEYEVTLVGGTKAITIPSLPGSAIVQVSRKTAAGVIGELGFTQTTKGITITSSSNQDTSTITVTWTSSKRGDGGVFTRSNSDDSATWW